MNNNKYSVFKIAWFPDKLNSFLEDRITAPIYVRIKPTNRCCHNCYFCVYKNDFSHMHGNMRRQDKISKEKMFEILEDLRSIGVKVLTFSGGGEPLLHEDIVQIMDKTLECGLGLSILTNGQLLSGERAERLAMAKWIRVSMNYWNPQMFSDTRGGSRAMFEAIVTNISSFADLVRGKSCDLGINYVISKDNYQTIDKAYDFLCSLGVQSVRFSPLWIPNFSEYHVPIMDEVLEMIRAVQNKNEAVEVYHNYLIGDITDKRSYTRCHFMQVVPVIGADCNVYACHNKAYDDTGLVGSIKDKKFSELWFSEETHDYFRVFRPDLVCGHQCANERKNIFIQEMIRCYGDDYV